MGEKSVPRSTFIKQFINRDLLNIDEFSQLEWRLIGRNLTKQEVLDWMISTEGKSALNALLLKQDMAPKMRIWFGLNSVETTINNQKIATFLDANFASIFKNK